MTVDRFEQFARTAFQFGVAANLDILKGYSHTMASHCADDALDFVFIDGTHSYGGVMDDIKVWSSKIKPTSYIGGHDYINALARTSEEQHERNEQRLRFNDNNSEPDRAGD